MRKEAERHEESMREQRRRFEAELRAAEERAMQSNMKLAGLAAGGKENRKVRSPRNPPLPCCISLALTTDYQACSRC